MYNIERTEKAERDLINIWHYTNDNFGIKQADKYYFEVITKLDVLKTNPKIGVDCSYIRQGYRKCIVNKHIAFYFINEPIKAIYIVRILGKGMDFEKHL